MGLKVLGKQETEPDTNNTFANSTEVFDLF